MTKYLQFMYARYDTKITLALHGKNLDGLAFSTTDGTNGLALTALSTKTNVTARNEHHLFGPLVADHARVVFFFALCLRFRQFFDLLFLFKRDRSALWQKHWSARKALTLNVLMSFKWFLSLFSNSFSCSIDIFSSNTGTLWDPAKVSLARSSTTDIIDLHSIFDLFLQLWLLELELFAFLVQYFTLFGQLFRAPFELITRFLCHLQWLVPLNLLG